MSVLVVVSVARVPAESKSDNSAIITIQSAIITLSENITAIHSSIDHSPTLDRHSPCCSFAGATNDMEEGMWS